LADLRFVVSLTNDDNDYQVEQAVSAQATARRLGVDLEIFHANNDAIEQSQQILKVVQSSFAGNRPAAIIVEPVGTPLPQAARAAVGGGIGWVLLNRDADYLAELRESSKVPVFAISSNHEEIGRIQGRQFAALLPNGGTVLYIQGPAGDAAAGRTSGMLETKPANIHTKMLRGSWTEESAQKAVSSWLRLSTSKDDSIDIVGAQDDSMAMGARKAFQDDRSPQGKSRWEHLLFTGCDGLPKTGQTWVRSKILMATVVVPANTGLAMEMLVKARRSGVNPPEIAFTEVSSYPAVEALAVPRKK
jgi:ABC-type sugar transport system substrate-binding protein